MLLTVLIRQHFDKHLRNHRFALRSMWGARERMDWRHMDAPCIFYQYHFHRHLTHGQPHIFFITRISGGGGAGACPACFDLCGQPPSFLSSFGMRYPQFCNFLVIIIRFYHVSFSIGEPPCLRSKENSMEFNEIQIIPRSSV